MSTAAHTDLHRIVDALEARQRDQIPSGGYDVASQAWWDHAQLLAGLGYAQRQLTRLNKQQGVGTSDTANLERRLAHLSARVRPNSSMSASIPQLPLSRSSLARPERLYEYLQDTLADDAGEASNSDEEEEEEAEESTRFVDDDSDEEPIVQPQSQTQAQSSASNDAEVEDEYESAAIALGRKSDTYPPPSAPKNSIDPLPAPSASDTLLQSSRAEHDALTSELLRMASTLRANSLSFAAALERDRRLLEAAGEKLEGNLDIMTRTRGRLGVYAKKARGMGWFTLGAILTVVMSWVGLFIVIKLT